MTYHEKTAWGSLVGSGLVLAWFAATMTDGTHIIQHTPEALFWIYLKAIIAFIIVMILVQTVPAILSKGRIPRDERDREIDLKAKRNGTVVTVGLISAGLFSMLSGAVFPVQFGLDLARGGAFEAALPSLSLWLAGSLLLGSVAEYVSAVAYHRL